MPNPKSQQSKRRHKAKMNRIYCDYCDVYLRGTSQSVKQKHYTSPKHLENVKAYYEMIQSKYADYYRKLTQPAKASMKSSRNNEPVHPPAQVTRVAPGIVVGRAGPSIRVGQTVLQ